MTHKQKWWKLFLKHESELAAIMERFQAVDPALWHKAAATADIKRLKHYLETAWMNAPDRPWIHQIPGWAALCDLCSDDLD
jgi:hypothetical protein